MAKFKTILTDYEANHDNGNVLGVQKIIRQAGISCERISIECGELISNGKHIQVLFSAQHFVLPNDFDLTIFAICDSYIDTLEHNVEIIAWTNKDYHNNFASRKGLFSFLNTP